MREFLVQKTRKWGIVVQMGPDMRPFVFVGEHLWHKSSIIKAQCCSPGESRLEDFGSRPAAVFKPLAFAARFV
jgi:hypothetical protein